MSNQCLGQRHFHTQTARQSLLPMLDSHSTRSHVVSSGNAFRSKGTLKNSPLTKEKKKDLAVILTTTMKIVPLEKNVATYLGLR